MHAIGSTFRFYVAVGVVGAFTFALIKAVRYTIEQIKYTTADPWLAGIAMFFVVIAVLMLCMKR